MPWKSKRAPDVEENEQQEVASVTKQIGNHKTTCLNGCASNRNGKYVRI